MSSLLSSHESAIRLLFDARTYVAGERISGVVELDFRMALEDKIEQVRVKLRGSASTSSERVLSPVLSDKSSASGGQQTITYRSSLPLAHGDTILWNQAEGNYPPAGTHIIQLPFEFQIPTDSPSSFHAIRYPQEATISYGIEVVADRHGLFRFKRRIGYVFPVLSRASREEVENAFQLRQGWPGEWRGFEHSEQIRKHLWGDRSSVQAQLQLPAVGSFPVGIPIAISLVVTTITKTMSKSDTPEDAFSASPDKPLSLRPRKVPDGSQGQPGLINDHLPSRWLVLASRRPALVMYKWPIQSRCGFQKKERRGNGSGQVTFDTIMVLKCPPTIDLGIIQCSYVLKIEIPFPGMGNNLEFQTPINVNSGFGPFDPNGPAPQALDLPPSYFTGEHHDWDGDGKSG
ncbi:hypothetical protein BKA70DRAFT_1394636 [Coprinopsis sp. MPI-PUGE-AT-0042]|nr:hypothetical protein BKA70DRAFT_1394636 [Coprinopsis sp. MPI-PUGE-AT-0042]